LDSTAESRAGQPVSEILPLHREDFLRFSELFPIETVFPA